MTTQSDSGRSLAAPGVVALIGTLVAIYMVSQFLRNSVGVIAPDLAAEIGLSPFEVGLLSSSFFLAFAAVQLPLGVAIDRFGPRRCLLVCAVITVGGAVMFALATTPAGLTAARLLLGIGSCSSFMAPLAIYVRRFAPEQFATLAGLQLGLGTIGSLLATAPLAFAAAAIGWRGSFLVVGVLTLLIGVLVAAFVTDKPAATFATPRRESFRESLAGILEVLRTRSVGRLFAINLTSYSSFALVVGLWGAPYLTHSYGYGLQARGDLLFVAVLAQILGSLLWGPLDRVFGGYKLPVLLGSVLTAAALVVLAVAGTLTPAMLFVWFAAFGFVSAYTPLMIAHGMSVFPPHLSGRGMTLLNIGSIGGVFLSQTLSGAVIDLFPTQGGVYPLEAYRVVFALQAGFVLLVCVVYAGAYEPAHPRTR